MTSANESASTQFRPVAVAPSYNNAVTVLGVLERIVQDGHKLIVINDGSTDGTRELLDGWAAARPGATVHHHRENKGKAAALHSGFTLARELGYTHVVTMDTDGQLLPEEIGSLLDVARQHPHALIVGARQDQIENCPSRSLVGRKVSNLLIRMESGVRVTDSQCGLRVYPLDLVREARCREGRFSFETEVITRAGWAGYDVIGVPVTCTYLPPGQRVSHFKPWLDTFRAIRMHLYLLLVAMLPWSRRTRPDETAQPLTIRRRLHDFGAWLNPMHVWRELRRGGSADRASFSAGFAIGVFIANLPIYGLQTLAGVYTARRLHLHPLSVVAGSQISTPPIGPALIFAAIVLGHMILHGAWPHLAHYDPKLMSLSMIGSILLEWTLGSIVVGFVLAVVSFVVVDLLCRMVADDEVAAAVSSVPAGAREPQSVG